MTTEKQFGKLGVLLDGKTTTEASELIYFLELLKSNPKATWAEAKREQKKYAKANPHIVATPAL
jgi:hypothetical protein|tara:strand:+ start:507 stop:698 length:192 start_codon:yes stop_codon:yes gene_type:complete